MPRVYRKQQQPVTISDRTWNGEQSWYREVIEVVGGCKLRLKVRVNAYPFQSYARAQVWRDGKWSEIHTIPGEQLQTKASYVERGVQPARFDADIAELRRVAKAVLS